MKKAYVKSEKEYERSSEFDAKKILEASKRRKAGQKVPTSVALDPELVADIKEAADENDVPYQVLLRMFIVNGFKKWKKHG